MEFYREFEFDFGDGLKTKKELLLGSNTIGESIFSEDKNTIFDYLHSLIEDAIIKKEGEIKRFIGFSKKNPYLSLNEIYSILLISMPPDRDIFTLPIPYPTLKNLIGKEYQIKVTKKKYSYIKIF